MARVEFLTIEAEDPVAAGPVYEAIGVADRVRLRQSSAPTSGFRGWSLSLVVAQPDDVDALIEGALEAGASAQQPAKKSIWGYGGAVTAVDGTLVTFASSSKKRTGTLSGRIDACVVQLGAADVRASKQFYTEQGFVVARSMGKYVEFESGPSIQLTLNSPKTVAKLGDMSSEGTGSHRVVFASDAGDFTDPDGFEWEAAARVDA